MLQKKMYNTQIPEYNTSKHVQYTYVHRLSSLYSILPTTTVSLFSLYIYNVHYSDRNIQYLVPRNSACGNVLLHDS